MSRRLREDLTVLIPSLRAYAFCLLLNHTHADISVEEALVELWSQAKGKTMPGLKLRAFQIVRKTCLMRAKIDLIPDTSDGKRTPLDTDFERGFVRLPLPEREALSLGEVFGFRPDEIARICCSDRGTMDRLVDSARLKLEASLQLSPLRY